MVRGLELARPGVVLLEQVQKRIEVQATESDLVVQCEGGMSDQQLVVGWPDVGFNTDAARGKGRMERYVAPVVIV